MCGLFSWYFTITMFVASCVCENPVSMTTILDHLWEHWQWLHVIWRPTQSHGWFNNKPLRLSLTNFINRYACGLFSFDWSCQAFQFWEHTAHFYFSNLYSINADVCCLPGLGWQLLTMVLLSCTLQRWLRSCMYNGIWCTQPSNAHICTWTMFIAPSCVYVSFSLNLVHI